MKKDFRSISQMYRDMHKPQLNEAVANTASLEYGTSKARNEYAKDTPGQSGGDPAHEPTHASKTKFGLSVDGIPKKGGEMVKPDNNVTTGLKVEGHDSEPELVDEKMAKKDHDNDGKVETKSAEYLGSRDKAIKNAMKKEGKMDPVGKADADIDNDGDVDTSDKYLHKKRKAIKKAMAKEDTQLDEYGMVMSAKKPSTKVKAKENPVVKPMGAKITEAEKDMKVKNCGCGQDPCKTYGSKEDQMKEGLGDMVKKGVEKVKKVRNDIKNFHKTDTAAAIRKDGMLIKKRANEGFQVPEYSVFAEAMSVTLRPSKSQPGSYKVHSVGSKMAAHGGMKPGERVKDHEIDGMKDSQIKVKYRKEDTDLDEAGRWDDTTTGRRYRNMSPEEKKRMARTNALKKRAKSVYKGRGDLDKVSEAMSPLERKNAAAKIFKMHQAKKGNAQKAKSAAMRDSSGYKTSDDSHLDSKPSPKPKGKKGISDTPHIVGQLRGVVDTKGNHKGVQFKDGSTHKVSSDHAKSWLAKHDASKPADKMKMYKHHDSHKSFKSGMSEDVMNEISDTTKLSYIDKTNRKITDKEKIHMKIGAYNVKDKKLEKMRKGVAMAKGKLGEDNLNELSPELVKKVAHARNVNVSMAGSKADYDRRDPDYQKAANKQDRNQKLRFSRGASAAGRIAKGLSASMNKEELVKDQITGKMRVKGPSHVSASDINNAKSKYAVKPIPGNPKYKGKQNPKFEKEEYTDKQVRMAKGIAFDKRHVAGDYSGAAKKMEKIKKGLSDHPKAKDALRRANEQKDFAKSLFSTELNELSKDTLSSYKDKADKQMPGLRDKMFQPMGKDNSNFKKNMSNLKKRRKGIETATAKMDQKEAIERRADRKTIIATDPATGRKVVKMAPKKEIDVGKGKMA
jgi:hypothetical protein